jgi:NAD+ kinase
VQDYSVLATYAADGVIVASPTGSTGYSLSAGGPLIHPSSPVLVVTPVAPHTLSARSLVIPDTESVRLTIEGEDEDSPKEIFVSADGQKEWALERGDSVIVRRAEHVARLLSVGGPNFYQKIRSRWHYGERTLPRSAP